MLLVWFLCPFFVCRMQVHSSCLLCILSPYVLHNLVKHLPPWSDSHYLQYPMMCELKSPTIVISFPFLLPVLIAKFIHSIDWFGRLLLMLLASILRIFGVVLSLWLCTGSKKLSFPNSTLKCSSFLTSIPTPFLPFPV